MKNQNNEVVAYEVLRAKLGENGYVMSSHSVMIQNLVNMLRYSLENMELKDLRYIINNELSSKALDNLTNDVLGIKKA